MSIQSPIRSPIYSPIWDPTVGPHGDTNQLTNGDFSGGTHDESGLTVPDGFTAYIGAQVSAMDVVGGNLVFTAINHLGGVQQTAGSTGLATYKVRARRISGSSTATLQVFSGVWNEVVAAGTTEDLWVDYEEIINRTDTNFILSQFQVVTAEWEVEFVSLT